MKIGVEELSAEAGELSAEAVAVQGNGMHLPPDIQKCYKLYLHNYY